MDAPTAIPNLFDFGSKELSQDAFVAWLVSWLNVKADGEAAELRCLSQQFVLLLLEKGVAAAKGLQAAIAVPEEILPPLDGESRAPLPHLQYHKIDVYFRVRTADNATYSVIVEDKTDTTMHDQQLARYRKIIHDITGGDGKEPVICIYFKKGHLFFWEERWVRDSEYGLLEARELLSLLDSSPAAASNMIVREYAEHLRSVLSERGSEEADLARSVPAALKRDFCQDLFMRSLLEHYPDSINMETTAPENWYAAAVLILADAPCH